MCISPFGVPLSTSVGQNKSQICCFLSSDSIHSSALNYSSCVSVSYRLLYAPEQDLSESGSICKFRLNINGTYNEVKIEELD